MPVTDKDSSRTSMERGEYWPQSTLLVHERMFEERDRLYTAKFEASEKAVAAALAAQEKAVSAALAAQEKAVAAAFEASEKAITKAEAAQTAYNARSNEFRQALDDQGQMMLTRTEADAQFAELRRQIESQGAQIQELQRGESRGSGMNSAAALARQSASRMTTFLIGTGLTVLGLVLSILFTVFGKR